MGADTRERFLTAATTLFRRQGYHGTGLKQIVAHGGAPIGSLYHFFPGGKQDLALAAIARTRDRYDALLDRVFDRADDTSAAAINWFAMAARALEDSDFADGCPIGTVAGEVASTEEAIRQASAAVLASWRSRVADQLTREGVSPARAQQLALLAVSSLEGAILLSRSDRDTSALHQTGQMIAEILRAETSRPDVAT